MVLSMSARSIDRALKPHRSALKKRLCGRTKPGTLLEHQIPIRSERWDTTEAGWCETDTVVHCGDALEGECAWSVNLCDVASTWTETRAVKGKSQRFVVEALEEIRHPYRLPGGLWIPPQFLPHFAAVISPYLPTRAYGELLWGVALPGHDPTRWLLALAAFALAFSIVAIRGYRRDERTRYA